MVWYDITIGNHKGKYTPLNPNVKEFLDCDVNGNTLKRVSGTFTKGYFENEKGEKFDKAFKLVNGKASSGFVGRISNVPNPTYIPIEEVGDILKTDSKEYLLECESLYNELVEKKQAIVFNAWFGNGFSAYKCFVYSSPLYKGFLEMVATKGRKSEIIKEIVGELTEKRKLKEMLEEIDNVNKNMVKTDDLIDF